MKLTYELTVKDVTPKQQAWLESNLGTVLTLAAMQWRDEYNRLPLIFGSGGRVTVRRIDDD